MSWFKERSSVVFAAVALLLGSEVPAVSADCASTPQKQLSNANVVENGGYLILRRWPEDKQPFLLKEQCVVLDKKFWPRERTRFLYLGLVNYVPGQHEADVSYLGVKVLRARGFPTSDLIRVYRNANWVVPEGDGYTNLPKLAGRVVGLTVDQWNALHANKELDIHSANEQLANTWHASAAEEVGSSWDLRSEWIASGTGHVFMTNMLIRFEVNSDPQHISVIPFELGVPADAREMVVEVHSNIEAIGYKVIFRFGE